MSGPLAGLGAFVEVQWKDSFYMDNANLLKAPGYELVNLNVHYKTDLASDYFKIAESVSRGQERVRPDLCGVRKQYREYGNGRGCSKSGERIGEYDGFDLCRIAARVHRRNEGGIQMIDGLAKVASHDPNELFAAIAFALWQTAAYGANESPARFGSGVR